MYSQTRFDFNNNNKDWKTEAREKHRENRKWEKGIKNKNKRKMKKFFNQIVEMCKWNVMEEISFRFWMTFMYYCVNNDKQKKKNVEEESNDIQYIYTTQVNECLNILCDL